MYAKFLNIVIFEVLCVIRCRMEVSTFVQNEAVWRQLYLFITLMD